MKWQPIERRSTGVINFKFFTDFISIIIGEEEIEEKKDQLKNSKRTSNKK